MANRPLCSPRRSKQFVSLVGELKEKTVQEAKSLGFTSRLLTMVNLPYRNPGKNVQSWWRENGKVTLTITPGYKKDKSIGIPYGTYPRLIMAYLITQAVRTGSPEIFLGKSFRDFLKLLDIEKGGKTYIQLQKQLEKVLAASFAWNYENENLFSRENIQIAHRSLLWWDPRAPDQQSLWDNYIKLNTDFFNEITRKAVPLDLRVLKVLKNSPLGLDLYMFLSWRVFSLKKAVYIDWKTLHNQLGGQYTNLKEFSRDCRKHLRRIDVIWPELNIHLVRGCLCVKPTSISPIPTVSSSHKKIVN